MNFNLKNHHEIHINKIILELEEKKQKENIKSQW